RTRCVVCEAEHEFKKARMPVQRKKSTRAALFTQVLDNLEAPARLASPESAVPVQPPAPDQDPPSAPSSVPAPDPVSVPPPRAVDQSDDRPFRRSLIRAQLPRPEGHPPPPRAIPEFTMHQPLNPRGKHGGGGGRGRRRPGHAGHDN